MRTTFYDASSFKNNNLIRIFYSAESVSYFYDRFTFKESVKIIIYFAFILRI